MPDAAISSPCIAITSAEIASSLALLVPRNDGEEEVKKVGDALGVSHLCIE